MQEKKEGRNQLSEQREREASRLFPTEAAVSRFVAKIRSFLTWLVKTGPVSGVTLGELGESWGRTGKPGAGQVT